MKSVIYTKQITQGIFFNYEKNETKENYSKVNSRWKEGDYGDSGSS